MVIKNSEHFFYCCDGTALKSAKEMLDWMRTTSSESFGHHINEERNDFCPWVKSILRDGVLSKKIGSCFDREEIIEIVSKRLESKNKNTKKDLISQIKQAVSHEQS